MLLLLLLLLYDYVFCYIYFPHYHYSYYYLLIFILISNVCWFMLDLKLLMAVKKSQEEIVNHFQKLRSEQRNVGMKISDIEMDQNEHKLVIETLQDLDPSRRCFRMVGGVLVERDVGSVLPTLRVNFERMGEVLVKLNAQLIAKGKEITAYKEKYQIKIEGEKEEREVEMAGEKKTTQGVLV